MNIILISTYSTQRIALRQQTLSSMEENASDWKRHHLTVVMNGDFLGSFKVHRDVAILAGKVGASRSRNIGASSIPKYLRHKKVMFCDDDCYFTKNWDIQLERAANVIISGHAHPFNHTVLHDYAEAIKTNVLSTVQMCMPWEVWDDVGFFTEPGGPGGSEDVDYCLRATAKGYGLFVTKPQSVLHCGLTSSSGTPIVGAEHVRENNRRLEEIHGIVGKVHYA